ncbi:extracellular solute-binding protein [Paenibacillus sp. Leaf72]|uniref:extracellular solute-binding protein n=1 Tax=Paenibacillus sp. Leaf72 TaxID=1736234 RepID=UPI0006FF4AC5|nr:extracellular solute-binding protein [Paenibacillus sp. Leaf72]KQO00699.1 ABC transporter substrate-binding protein [Paenibacillus sp. Leaf72]
MRKKQAATTFRVLCTTTLAGCILAGCASGSGVNEGSATSGTNQGGAPTSETQAPFKLTIMTNLHTPEVPTDAIEKMLEEKTNTDLTINWVPDGSYEEKLNSSFATGSLPQAVYMKNQTTYILFRDAIRNNQFWEIGPFIKDYPNLSKLDELVVKNTAVDGKTYAIYQERPLSRQGIIFRKDWADKLGLAAPKTTDELYNMLKQFKEGDPDGNGKADTMGLTDRSDLVYGAFKTVASYFGTPNNWGLADGKLQPEFMFPQYKETMDFFKKLYDEGLINKDFPVTSKEDQQNLVITGKAGMYIGSMADVQSLHQKTVEINPNALYDVANHISGPDGNAGIWSIPGYGNLVLFPKSSVKSEEELKSILAFFDKLMEPELANLVKWGVPDKHYTIVEGGLVQKIEDTKMTDREQKPYEILQVGGESTIDMLRAYNKLPAKAKAEELIIENNSMLINDPTAALDSKTFGLKGVELQQIINDATYRYILGNLDAAGFDGEIERWKKGGGESIITEYNESLAKSQ